MLYVYLIVSILYIYIIHLYIMYNDVYVQSRTTLPQAGHWGSNFSLYNYIHEVYSAPELKETSTSESHS